MHETNFLKIKLEPGLNIIMSWPVCTGYELVRTGLGAHGGFRGFPRESQHDTIIYGPKKNRGLSLNSIDRAGRASKQYMKHRKRVFESVLSWEDSY